MEIIYQPRINREIESFIERIHPPRVCVDNDSCKDCTVVKIDSANRNGKLLEMVQALTDLDLIISKSYISSDGGWLMDVFHVTDQVGNKIIDKNHVLHYIQQALCESISSKEMPRDIELPSCSGPQQQQQHASLTMVNVALEVAGTDRPGLFSDISTVLLHLGFSITSATAWTHNNRAACIFYLDVSSTHGLINDPIRMAHVQAQIHNVMVVGEDRKRRSVRFTCFATGRNHTERRLHQMMYADGDYESCRACHVESSGEHKKGCDGTHVSVSRCEEKGYWVVNVRSRDRPKLLFDTVCVLTDMEYSVFHAAMRSNGFMADQEYFVRHKNSSALDKEIKREKLSLCLIAAIERRVSHGLKVDIRTQNRTGLLSNVTRVIRENGLSIRRVQIGVEEEGKLAVGSLYVTDCSGKDVNPNTVMELVRREAGGFIVAVHSSSDRVSQSSPSTKRSTEIKPPRSSLGTMLWSHLERLSTNFAHI